MMTRFAVSMTLALGMCAIPALARSQPQPQPSAQAPQRPQPAQAQRTQQAQPRQSPSTAAPRPAPTQAAPTPRPTEAQTARAPSPVPAPVRGQPINIQVEVTITDQNAPAAPRKKTVTIVAGDKLMGSIRTTATYSNLGPVPLNVDVQPTILPGGKIQTDVSLQYTLPALTSTNPAPGQATDFLRQTTITETLRLLLDNGRPLVVAQSADPVGDRQVTIEIKAVILR